MKYVTYAVLIAVITCLYPFNAHALWTGADGKIKAIGKIKAQATWRMEDAPPNNPIPIEAGDMISQRNLLMLEWKHDVGKLVGDLKSEYYLQGRAYYDGVWDYGPKEFSDDEFRHEYTFDNRDQINDLKKGVDLYIAYVDLVYGHFFARTGRQVMAWGEMSTIRILDGTNPMNTSSLAVDMSERRIPLWMLRANYATEFVGPFDSLSLEGYYIPGKIDNTYEEDMIDGSAILPTIGRDTQADLANPFSMASLKKVINQEESDIDEDRFGLRFGMLSHGLDLNFCYYRMYSEVPVPYLNAGALKDIYLDSSQIDFTHIMQSILGDQKLVVELTRDTVDVFGLSFNTNLTSIDTIMRGEAAYFKDVPKMTPGKFTDVIAAFAPKIHIAGLGGIEDLIGDFPLGDIAKMDLSFTTGEIAKFDVVKYGIGFDKFQKIPFLGPDDYMFTVEYVGSKILDYKRKTIMSPWYAPWDDNQDGQYDTVWEKEYSNTFILITQTRFLNGNLTPMLVAMYEVEPQALVLIPSFVYEWKNFQFEVSYFLTESKEYTGTLGMLDKRDEFTVNITWNF